MVFNGMSIYALDMMVLQHTYLLGACPLPTLGAQILLCSLPPPPYLLTSVLFSALVLMDI